MKRILPLAALALLAACESTTPPDSSVVAVRVSADFENGAGGLLQRAEGPRLAAMPGWPRRTSPAPPGLLGSNGMLLLDHVFIVADRLRLETGTGECGMWISIARAPCEVRSAPFLLWMPGDRSRYELVRQSVAVDAFQAVGFSPGDLDSTGLPDGERERVDSLLADARQRVPGFPPDAVMGVRGVFSSGTAWREFVVYFRADDDVLLPLEQAMEIPGLRPRTVELRILPGRWFRDGTAVVDLSQYDGQTVDLGGRFADGFEVHVAR